MSIADGVEQLYRPRFDSLTHQKFFGYSGYSNFGYWHEHTRGGKDSGDGLVDKLVSLLPEVCGTLLDVACGQGGTTRRLSTHFKPQDITAINISETQLTHARASVPDCTFLQMSATDLAFEDAAFDNVFCQEAAFHFNTRERFLRESYRVLRPGGHLVLSDILFERPRRFTKILIPDYKTFPAANFIDPDQYREMLARIGFEEVEMISAVEQTFLPHARKLFLHHVRELLTIKRWPGVLWQQPPLPALAVWLIATRRHMIDYLLIRARRPR